MVEIAAIVSVLGLMYLLYSFSKRVRLLKIIDSLYEMGYDEDTTVGEILSGKTPHEVMNDRMNRK